MVQVLDLLPSSCKTLSSNPHTTIKERKNIIGILNFSEVQAQILRKSFSENLYFILEALELGFIPVSLPNLAMC
jgi:hypothetical protein